MCLAAAGWAAVLAVGGCRPEEPARVVGSQASEVQDPAAAAAPAEAVEPTEAAGPPPPVERDWPAAELRAGGAVEAELDRDETHVYRLPLEAGEYLRIRVEQDGVDVELRLLDPAGQELLFADRLIGEFGPEHVLAVSAGTGTYTLVIHECMGRGPGRYEARIEALRPSSDEDRTAAEAYRRFRAAEAYARQDRERAVAVWTEALAVWRGMGEAALEAEVVARLALDHYDSQEWALSAARYGEAIGLLDEAGERVWQLRPRHDLATLLFYLVEYDQAIRHYRAVGEIAREIGDRRLEGIILNGLGSAYRAQGELQQALENFEAALEVLPEDDPHARPLTLHNLAALHWRHFQDPTRSRKLLLAAQELYRPEEIPTHRAWRARTLKDLGLLAQEEGDATEARRHIEAALAIETGFDRCGRALALASLASLEEEVGARRVADTRMAEAFATLGSGACEGSEVTLHLVGGKMAERRGEASAALASFRRSRELATALGDRTRLADALAGIARAERALGHLDEALAASRQVLAIVEDVRPTVLREDLRTAYFATAQEHFDLHIRLLTEAGEPGEAWVAAERARAQALRDLLVEAGAGLRRGAEPALVERERALRRRLNALESARSEAAEAGGPRLATLREQLHAAVEDLERLRGEIRRQSPAYAALTAPDPLPLAELQGELLDADTLLLEYRLGEEESWLWAVTRHSFDAFSLPPRREIEAVALEAARWTRSLRWSGRYPPPLCELSRTVLGPVADLLGERRLVVVADGALEEVSFAALPAPGDAAACAEAEPLVAAHEVVHLPSAAALAAQRRLLVDRRPAPGWLAMVADPVYGRDDRRLGRPRTGPRPAALTRWPTTRFERLPHSGEEADAVLRGLPGSKVFVARGAGSSKRAVTGGALAGHRIVHFATHGVLDPERPLLSFLALSRVSADGRAVDGDLYAHEIYDLELPAELVVLSACDTAGGRHVRGEGLVSGLPRAFLYAGAARVLVSLWPVQDRSTRDLMDFFYRGLIEQGLPPGRALQEAQRSLWKSGRPPYQWAGFVLQGDWRPLPPF